MSAKKRSGVLPRAPQRVTLKGIPTGLIQALKKKRHTKGGKLPRWSKTEIDILRRFYPNVRSRDIARKLGRPLNGVYNMAFRMGLKKTHTYRSAMTTEILHHRYERR